MQSTELAHRHLNGRHNFHGFGKGAPPRNPVSPQPAKLEPVTEFKASSFWGHAPRPRAMSGVSLTTSSPYIHTHDGARTHLSPSGIPPHAGATRNGVDGRRRGQGGLFVLDAFSSWASIRQPSTPRRLGWDSESTAGSGRAAQGTEGQEGPSSLPVSQRRAGAAGRRTLGPQGQ